MRGTETNEPVVNMAGTVVALGPMRRDIIPSYQRWINDFRIQRTLGDPPYPRTIEAMTELYERSGTATDQVQFTIYERATMRPIGITLLREIDHRHRSAEFVIVIGEADARGRGYGTEAARLMLDYAFTALGLHTIMLRVFANNLAGIRSYRKAGFRECGRLRESHWIGGKLWDTLFMECLASEFESPVLAQIFTPDEARP